MIQREAKVIKNVEVTPGYCKILLRCSSIAKSARPGQFIEIKVSDSCEPLLRRPFSIHRTEDGNIEIFYEIVGIGTKALSGRKAGEYLDVIGPLGNGFDYRPRVLSQGSQILVAGGMGVAPLLFLAERLAYSAERIAQRKDKRELKLSLPAEQAGVKVLIGAKNKEHILCEKDFRKLSCEIKIATDDGSRGFKGKVTDLLRDLLSAKRYPLNAIYACGPHPMLKEIAAVSKKYNIPAQVSLEAHMACGIGACLGCVVNAIDGYKRVCKEGPVFDSEQIVWEK